MDSVDIGDPIGIGQFIVIDDNIVEEADLGVNFFLENGRVGKPRAEGTAALLGELNPDVKGNYIIDVFLHAASTLLREAHACWRRISKHTLDQTRTFPPVHVTFSTSPTHLTYPGISPSAAPARNTCVSCPFPRVYDQPPYLGLRSHDCGTHPDSLVDLRLLNPWPELSALAAEKTRNLDLPEPEGGMSDHEHGHVPYLLLLLGYLED